MMNDWSTTRSESVPNDTPESASKLKQAACLSCRRSKIRCLRGIEDARCKRCEQTATECIIPAYHVGRQKGIKNKRTGLDKAVHRIEQALKSKRGNDQVQDEETARHLQRLLNDAQNLSPKSMSSRDNESSDPRAELTPKPRTSDSIQNSNPLQQQQSSGDPVPVSRSAEDSLALEDAENPLQLLARASDFPLTTMRQLPIPVQHQSNHKSLLSDGDRSQELRSFFGPLKPNLDISSDIDPIDMGLITLEETDVLFNYFYQNLSHTRWGLDPHVHTATFVRSRSAFLFTSILAASALFLPSAAALSKRLSVHCKNLAHTVMANRYRSSEIVLAFMVNIPWMSPGKHWADDETCAYMAMALTIAMDLSLNKLVMPSPSIPYSAVPKNILKSDCITARKALDLDGFYDVDPASEWGKRLLRGKERIWLALFVLDRGVCLARGRSFTVPVTPLVEICDRWNSSDMADIWDTSIISSAVLRRDLAKLITDIKTTCDGDRARVVGGSTVVQALQDMIESFFNRWYATWAYNFEGRSRHRLPPYVDILVTHTRLSTYSSVINHPTAPIEVKQFFRAAGLSSSLNVMRAAVQGESQLKSMPNNTSIMISFAACFALYLSTAGSSMSLTPSIRRLIEETSDVLERIGATPSHRKGMSALYGRHLREVLRSSPVTSNVHIRHGSRDVQHLRTAEPSSTEGLRSYNVETQQVQPGPATSNMLTPESLQFSAMSDFQIIEAINNAGGELDTFLPDFQTDDRTGLDWLDWFSMDVGQQPLYCGNV